MRAAIRAKVTAAAEDSGTGPASARAELPSLRKRMLTGFLTNATNPKGIITYGNVIDSGYRGEIRVGVMNLGKEAYTFEPGNKVAQMIIHGYEEVKFEEVKDGELSTSDRGERGFGSTGK